jgi:hypothetical protein
MTTSLPLHQMHRIATISHMSGARIQAYLEGSCIIDPYIRTRILRALVIVLWPADQSVSSETARMSVTRAAAAMLPLRRVKAASLSVAN